jgi:molybdenum-dependent DNA-binding transcriptional regulator ModE
MEANMVRLTIALEEEVLERAQSKARRQGTSLDELLRSYLESYSELQQERDRQEAIKTLLDLSSKAQSGSGGRKWTRDELYER